MNEFLFVGCTDSLDYQSDCPYWADSGYCQHSYVDFMNENCAESCGHC